MQDFCLTKDLRFGESPANTQPIHMELREFRADGNDIAYRVVITGPFNVDKQARDSSVFHAVRTGLAGMRQMLRHLQKGNPRLRYFDDIGGKLIEQTVDDVFKTHDCVPEQANP